jgi:hypothetical protein
MMNLAYALMLCYNELEPTTAGNVYATGDAQSPITVTPDAYQGAQRATGRGTHRAIG